jgi:dihydrofolate reductase
MGYNYPKAFVEGNTLWVALTVNKEDVRVVRVILGRSTRDSIVKVQAPRVVVVTRERPSE